MFTFCPIPPSSRCTATGRVKACRTCPKCHPLWVQLNKGPRTAVVLRGSLHQCARHADPGLQKQRGAAGRLVDDVWGAARKTCKHWHCSPRAPQNLQIMRTPWETLGRQPERHANIGTAALRAPKTMQILEDPWKTSGRRLEDVVNTEEILEDVVN